MLLPPLLLSACNLGPHYARPDLAVPLTYREANVNDADGLPAADWWRRFHSAELDGLIAEAQAHNNTLAVAVAQVREADAAVRVAGSPLLPDLTGGAGGTTQQQGYGHNSATIRSVSATLNASYEVDVWGRNLAFYQSAQASAAASRFNQATVALTVVTSVASTYFTALAFKDELAVEQHNLAVARQSLAVISGRLAAGTASALDEAQQAAQVAGIEAQIPALRSQLEQEVIGLGILVGRPPETIDVTTDTLVGMPTPVPGAGLPSVLLIRRPDVALAEAQLVAQNGNVRAARAAFFPQISLTGSAGYASTALNALFTPAGFAASLAANAVQTIFDNGNLQGQYQEQRALFDELAADYRQAVLQAFTDVEDALTAYRYATEQEALLRRAVTIAQRAVDIAQAQLVAGTVDVTTLLTAQTTLFTDQSELAQVRQARYAALVSLYKALGGGWQQTLTIPGAT